MNNNPSITLVSAGFALALLVLHYLQAGCHPPVVPSLQRRFPDILPSNTTIIDRLRNRTIPANLRCLRSENTQSPGELLVGFFRYYSAFTWQETISIRTGGTQPTMWGKKWRNPHIRIEDPGDQSNVTRSVYEYHEFSRIKEAFSTASSRLQRSPTLDSIL